MALPREVGEHPETGEMIIANNGRYGPYLKYNNTFYSIPKDESPLTIGINRAVDIVDKTLKLSILTSFDKYAISYAYSKGCRKVFASFVSSALDVREIKDLLLSLNIYLIEHHF